jgi:uncharacterized protein (UPF0332 family)
MTLLREKALRAAHSARTLHAEQDYDGACDRAYYAMFNIARALLEDEGALKPDEAKTHGTVLRLFSEVFVLSGRAALELGRGFNFVQRLRAKADYSPVAVTAEESERAILLMEQLLQFATRYPETGKGRPA